MKTLLALSMGILMMVSMVAGLEAPSEKSLSSSPSQPLSQSSEAPVNKGGGKNCVTQWAWNGQKYVKRDLVKVYYTQHGVTVFNVHGNSCKILTKAPTTPGSTIDLTPLTYGWEKQ